MFDVRNQHGFRAIGARVRIEVAGADLQAGYQQAGFGSADRVRDVRTAYSYCAANDPRVHFGLGKSKRVRNVRVTWPDGIEQNFGTHDADQTVPLRRNKP